MKKKERRGLSWLQLLTVILFAALLLSTLVTDITIFVLIRFDLVPVSEGIKDEIGRLAQIIALINVPVGVLVALIFGKVPLRPLDDLVRGMNRLAKGDFKTRIAAGKVMRYNAAYLELVESFNKMAQELERTEMLRSDFINNFSHEFKTPIVSIAGFAKLLKRGNLTEAQQSEYLAIIEEESLRLSYMATNVLNLTKVENQSILTDVTSYNVSEQLRSCILLLEKKWEKKDITFQLDFEEYTVRANEELLKQVWINLLDNAIKFSPEGGEILVQIQQEGQLCRVAVENTGSQIPPEQLKKIFGKFYQVDESHAQEGNGIGLAIVKKVVELHKGSVEVTSEEGRTRFTVVLPQE